MEPEPLFLMREEIRKALGAYDISDASNCSLDARWSLQVIAWLEKKVVLGEKFRDGKTHALLYNRYCCALSLENLKYIEEKEVREFCRRHLVAQALL